MLKRRRFKQNLSLKDRLGLFAKEARSSADKLPPGPAKDELLRKARQADTEPTWTNGGTPTDCSRRRDSSSSATGSTTSPWLGSWL
jgi:hypothetical protein